MKKYSSLKKGFTLVELMIVIAIIGILAAVLYPSMTGYFERSRDTNRQTALRNLTVSLSTYNTDKSEYPAVSGSGACVGTALTPLVGQYIQALPKDPKNTFGVVGCATAAARGYGYQRIKDPVGTANASYVIGARMENAANANFVGPTGNGPWMADSAVMGSGTLVNVNNKIAGGTGSTAAGTAYYVVGQ